MQTCFNFRDVWAVWGLAASVSVKDVESGHSIVTIEFAQLNHKELSIGVPNEWQWGEISVVPQAFFISVTV